MLKGSPDSKKLDQQRKGQREKMKKIIQSVLSVAGLLAALLALSSGSASAETGLITVDSTNVRGGTYTVTWEALGGCNSGSDGSVSKAVKRTDSGGALTLGSFNTNNNCQYKFSATYVTDDDAGFNFPGGSPVAKGVRCAATTTPTGVDGDTSTAASVSVTASATDCIDAPKVVFTVNGPADDPDTAADESADRAAVASRKWVITAKPTGKGADGNEASAAAECAEVTGTTEKSGELQSVTLTVIKSGLLKEGASTSCQYDISVALQDGFVENAKDSSIVKAWDADDDAPVLLLKVATREVFVVQSVTGNSGGGMVEYSTEVSCSSPDSTPFTLPPSISTTATQGGIVTVKGRTLVPLNPGRYDVSQGIAGSMTSTMSGTTNRRAVISRAVANNGDNCSITITAKDVPAGCTVATASQTVNLLTINPQSIVEFSFSCTAAAPTTTAAPAATTTAEPATTTTVATSPPPDEPTGAEQPGMMSTGDGNGSMPGDGDGSMSGDDSGSMVTPTTGGDERTIDIPAG